MSVDLTGLPIRASVLSRQRFGGKLQGALGGPAQHIDRAGDRYSQAIETPPMRVQPDGREWHAKLLAAEKEGGLFRISQPGLDIGNPGAPVIAAATLAGTTIPVAGLAAGYVVRAGQWFSIIHAGRRYADQARYAVAADAGGNAAIVMQNLLRVSLAAGDVVEIALPKIEGSVDGVPLDLPVTRTTSFSIRVDEDE
ncbi:hypothetical protein [Sphingomonas faeni]|uniref:hypothetical protein n=1 Tax=Sphingomonas faeni TaxID=185950 RepID=UPI003357E81D